MSPRYPKGYSGNLSGRKKSHTREGAERYTSSGPNEECPVPGCKVIIRKHLRCPLCDILVGPGHEVAALENPAYCRRIAPTDDYLHPDAVFWLLGGMVESLKSELKSKREHKRALAYVQSGDFAQWAELMGVSASAAREWIVRTATAEPKREHERKRSGGRTPPQQQRANGASPLSQGTDRAVCA